MSKIDPVWRYNEFSQVGKDYAKPEEVARYEARHSDFRNLEAEADTVLDTLGVGPEQVLVDLGCGPGILAVQAARRCARVHAVDVSAAMLEHARNKARNAGVSNIEFHHQGFLDVDLPDASVDVVTSTFVLHHLPDYWKAVALERIHAMLGSGGIFYLHDVVIDPKGAAANIQAAIDELGRAGGQGMKEDAEAHFREEFSTFDWIMDGLLQRAGFRIEDTVRKDGVYVSYRCVKAG